MLPAIHTYEKVYCYNLLCPIYKLNLIKVWLDQGIPLYECTWCISQSSQSPNTVKHLCDKTENFLRKTGTVIPALCPRLWEGYMICENSRVLMPGTHRWMSASPSPSRSPLREGASQDQWHEKAHPNAPFGWLGHRTSCARRKPSVLAKEIVLKIYKYYGISLMLT
jgi:hypothetical protein